MRCIGQGLVIKTCNGFFNPVEKKSYDVIKKFFTCYEGSRRRKQKRAAEVFRYLITNGKGDGPFENERTFIVDWRNLTHKITKCFVSLAERDNRRSLRQERGSYIELLSTQTKIKKTKVELFKQRKQASYDPGRFEM
ncbi:hypothetical protein TNIN_264441 [Trichonephila inaurata madagascariensis]|uniref:Uncharacterized protein n=1 Tax=Trichonephila inaurata madagascariensis TaxID=2747483 RepID=A0A8X6IBD1_9ARAC|nr:hypothetical protein TNIN_264441 [Trichonephila inaurata madagascariensis]